MAGSSSPPPPPSMRTGRSAVLMSKGAETRWSVLGTSWSVVPPARDGDSSAASRGALSSASAGQGADVVRAAAAPACRRGFERSRGECGARASLRDCALGACWCAGCVALRGLARYTSLRSKIQPFQRNPACAERSPIKRKFLDRDRKFSFWGFVAIPAPRLCPLRLRSSKFFSKRDVVSSMRN